MFITMRWNFRCRVVLVTRLTSQRATVLQLPGGGGRDREAGGGRDARRGHRFRALATLRQRLAANVSGAINLDEHGDAFVGTACSCSRWSVV